METTFIYALCDPDTEIIRYIGKSDDPKVRYVQHIKDKHKTYKVNWIKKLKSSGKVPLLKILEEVDKNCWETAEKKWINRYRLVTGRKLTNTTEGGAGPNMTEEIRRKISKSSKGHIVSEEQRKKISIANKGRIITPEWRRKISEAFTPEFRKRLSERRRGKKLSPESCQKISTANKGKKPPTLNAEARKRISDAKKGQSHSIETRQILSEATKRYFSNQEARDKQSNSITKWFSDHPEAKSRKAESCRNQWNDPIARKKILDARKGSTLNIGHRKKISESLKKHYSDPLFSSSEEHNKRSERTRNLWNNPEFRKKNLEKRKGMTTENYQSDSVFIPPFIENKLKLKD